MTTTLPLSFTPPAVPEDRARADLYALAARLFYAPPDTSLLEVIAEAEAIVGDDTSAPLAAAWRNLQRACAATDEEAAQGEYDSIFGGVGKAEVSPYVSAYLGAVPAQSTLADLREFLAARGPARRESVNEPEDHIAALCDVMRGLAARQHFDLDEQRFFFHRFVWPGALALCEAVIACRNARFYRSVARFVKSFLDLEHAAFEML